jgi:uncharacterized protein (TIGR00297 family)
MDGTMVNVLTLDGKGVALAVVLGALILFLGQGQGPFFLLVIVLFLATAAVVTHIGKDRKKGLGIYEKKRGWQNVIANGLGPLIIAAIYAADNWYLHLAVPLSSIAIVYVASVSAVAADKFASEIGVLDGEPFMLLTLQRVKKGVSGGISPAGLAASLLGSFIISLSVLPVSDQIMLVGITAAAGFLGSIVDSVMGYFEEIGMGNKYTSNFICSLAGAAVCAILLALL